MSRFIRGHVVNWGKKVALTASFPTSAVLASVHTENAWVEWKEVEDVHKK